MWVAEGPSWGPSFTGQGTCRLPPSSLAFVCLAAPAPEDAIFPCCQQLPSRPAAHGPKPWPVQLVSCIPVPQLGTHRVCTAQLLPQLWVLATMLQKVTEDRHST